MASVQKTQREVAAPRGESRTEHKHHHGWSGELSAEPVVLQLDHVKKVYQATEGSVPALGGVSFKVHKGEFVAVMGPSGSGKSTLLHLIGALDTASSGSVKIAGRDPADLSSYELARLRNEHIGFVFQSFNLVPTLTALQNVELPMMLRGTPAHERRKRAMELLEKVGLGRRVDHRPSEMSGGERQRVAIARALVNDPSFLLADEPTGNLDSKTGEDIMHFIYELWTNHKLTIIMVTHEPVVASHSQRIIRLRDGKVERELSKEEFAKYFSHETFKVK